MSTEERDRELLTVAGQIDFLAVRR